MINPLGLQAAGSMGTTTVVWNAGGVLVKSDTGIYTFTLDAGLDATQACVLCTLTGVSGIVRVTHTSDTVKTIETFAVDGTTATDKAFMIAVFRKPGA